MKEFTEAHNRLLENHRPRAKELPKLLARLANYGVLTYGDSQAESDLYELAAGLEDEVRDYFSLLGVTLFHNPHLRYMRLFPPGARSPVLAGTEGSQEEAADASMRRRRNPHVSALLLALRTVYQQKIAVGQDIVGPGEVTASLEEVYVTMEARLKRPRAPTHGEQREVLRELDTVWRVLRLPVGSDPVDTQTRISIRPMIADLISETLAADVESAAADIAAEVPHEAK
jgi:hypothetical protein